MAKQWSCWLFVVVAGLCGCGPATPELQLIHDAADAIGGVEAVRGAANVTMEGSGTTYQLGQNNRPDSEPPSAKAQSYRLSIDLENHRSRLGIASPNFAGDMVTTVTSTDGDVVYTVGRDGPRRTGGEAAGARQVLYYHHPLALLRAALAEDVSMAANVSDLRQEMGHDVVDITTADGIQLTLHVDLENRLPQSISSTGYNSTLGDIVTTTTFSAYQGGGGFRLPQGIARTVDGVPNLDLRVTQTVNGEIRDLAAPGSVTSASEPEPPPANVAVEELADGVWLLGGQSHHSVLVEFDEYTTLVEVPQHDRRTIAVIAQARELVPDKPLRYAVNTHHHFDHSGGVRAAIAEGLTVITHATNRSMFEDLAARAHTIVADHLAQNPATLMLETVEGDEVYELSDGDRTLQLYRVGDNPHCDAMLVAYLPTERILVQADMYIPGIGGPFAATAAALLESVRERELNVRSIVPIHGAVAPLSELEEAVEAQAAGD